MTFVVVEGPKARVKIDAGAVVGTTCGRGRAVLTVRERAAHPSRRLRGNWR